MAADLLDRTSEPEAPAARAAPVAPRPDPAVPAIAAAPRRFAGFTLGQLVAGILIVAALVWAMWATKQLLAAPDRQKIVTVRLSGLISDYVGAAARSGEPEQMLAKRTQAYMAELQKALKARSDAGEIVLVGEAVVSSSVEDITPSVAAEVAKVVPFPVARPIDPAAPSMQVPMAIPGAAVGAPAQPMMMVPPAQPAPADPTAGMAYPFGSGQ